MKTGVHCSLRDRGARAESGSRFLQHPELTRPPSPPQIESMYNDFEGKMVIDLGCGTVRQGIQLNPLTAS